MAEAIWLSRTGDADVLELKHIEPSDPRPGEAWVEQEAIGVNYLDVMQRRGAVPTPVREASASKAPAA
jgi:NADPH2:quinone reductase